MEVVRGYQYQKPDAEPEPNQTYHTNKAQAEPNVAIMPKANKTD